MTLFTLLNVFCMIRHVLVMWIIVFRDVAVVAKSCRKIGLFLHVRNVQMPPLNINLINWCPIVVLVLRFHVFKPFRNLCLPVKLYL
jgi:hypothetical protein